MGIERIMLVEDEPDLREVLFMILESHGYQVVTAATGEEAIRMSKDVEIDAVLIDLGLPDMNGREVAKALRGYPIAILTGADVNLDIPEAALLLQKPVTPTELIEAVEELLDQDVQRTA